MTHSPKIKRTFTLIFLATALLLVSACDVVPLHMRDQPRYDPLEASDMFDNGMASRPLPDNVMPRGEWGEIKMSPEFYTGRISEEEFVETVPIEVNREMLLRGQEQYDIFCSPCHGRVGDGQGMIVERGMRQPPSFHDQRLKDERAGYFYDVITNGFGIMYSYESRIKPADRWAIIAYVRALQFSQEVPLDSLSPEAREEVESQLN